MPSQFIDRWTRSERTVTVEVDKCRDAPVLDVDGPDFEEGIIAMKPLHEHRHRC